MVDHSRQVNALPPQNIASRHLGVFATLDFHAQNDVLLHSIGTTIFSEVKVL